LRRSAAVEAAAKVMGTRTDLEIFGMLAKEMKLNLGIWLPKGAGGDPAERTWI